MTTLDRRGLALGVAAYGMWAAFPLYFVLLKPAGSLEVIGHRIVWTAVFAALLVTLLRRWGNVRHIVRQPRLVATLGLAGALVTVNWTVYVFATLTGHVVEASLGYFINPLVTALLAVTVQREHLRPAQWIALGIGAIAVVVITVGYGAFPWIALALALSFGLYGLVKKRVGATVGALEGMGVETTLMVPFALIYLVFVQVSGNAHLVGYGPWHVAALVGCGIITALPLLAFNGATRRLPLIVIGLLQYLTPIGQFLVGVLIFHEPMEPARWAGFALVWVALIVVTVDSARSFSARSRRRSLPGTPL